MTAKMNREIKFRGKMSIDIDPDTGQLLPDARWSIGSLVYAPQKSKECYIVEHEGEDFSFEVEPETIGQFTGLRDKNGVEIYEGDIVRWDDRSKGRHWRIAIVKINPDIQFDCSLGLSHNGIKSSSRHTFCFGNFAYPDTHNHLEIIGNTIDNSELLKGGAQ